MSVDDAGGKRHSRTAPARGQLLASATPVGRTGRERVRAVDTFEASRQSPRVSGGSGEVAATVRRTGGASVRSSVGRVDGWVTVPGQREGDADSAIVTVEQWGVAS